MNVLFTNGLLANLRESIRRKHSVNGNVVRFMWHRLVGRLPGPADRYHARSDRTVFKCPIVPSSATPQTESLMIDGKSGNDDQSSVFQRFGPAYAVAGFLRTMCVGGEPGSDASKNLRKALTTVLADSVAKLNRYSGVLPHGSQRGPDDLPGDLAGW